MFAKGYSHASPAIRVSGSKGTHIEMGGDVPPAPCSVHFNVTLKRKKKSPKIPRASFEGYDSGPIY